MNKTRFEYLTHLSDAARLAAQACIHNGKEPPGTAGNMLAVGLAAESERAALTLAQAQSDQWDFLQQEALYVSRP